MNKDKINAIQYARKIVKSRPVYLDTETTGLANDDEVVDIAIVNYNGEILVDTLIRPTAPIPADATAIHGITNEDVISAPTYAEVVPNLQAYRGRTFVIYNKAYDLRLMSQSAEKSHTTDWGPHWKPPNSVCAMILYAEFYGDWNDYHKSYRWQSQSAAAEQLGIELPPDLHRAAADANLCRLIIEAVAATPLPGEAIQGSQLFIQTFNSLADHIHSIARAKGFWPDGQDRNDGELIALIHSELSEALTALRSGNPPDDYLVDFDSVEVKLADAIIEIMDMSIGKDLRVAQALIAKVAYNEDRPHKHGKKF